MSAIISRLRAHFNLLVLTGVTFITYYAATNRLQALPWAIAALLSSTLLTGIIWPYWLVRRLAVVRTGTDRAVEGDNATIHVDVENRGWMPRFMIQVVDRLPFAATPDAPDKVLGVIATLRGAGRKRFSVFVPCEKRGFYRLGPVGLASSFPLGLVQARHRQHDSMHNLTVYPRIFPILGLKLFGAPSYIHWGDYPLQRGKGDSEFTNLREYRRGDSPRHVHWPSTARLNELMIKEYEPRASACLHLLLDCQAITNVGSGRHSTFEYAMRIAGSITRYATAANLDIRLTAGSKQPILIPSGSGELQFTTIMDILAVIDADSSTPYAAVLEKAALDCPAGETQILFLSSSAHQHSAILQALGVLRSRHTHLFAIILEDQSFLNNKKSCTMTNANPLMDCLFELGAHCIRVRNGDDLVRVFNS